MNHIPSWVSQWRPAEVLRAFFESEKRVEEKIWPLKRTGLVRLWGKELRGSAWNQVLPTSGHTQPLPAWAHCQGEDVADNGGGGWPHPDRASHEGECLMAPPWSWNLGFGLLWLVHRKSPFPPPFKAPRLTPTPWAALPLPPTYMSHSERAFYHTHVYACNKLSLICPPVHSHTEMATVLGMDS